MPGPQHELEALLEAASIYANSTDFYANMPSNKPKPKPPLGTAIHVQLPPSYVEYQNEIAAKLMKTLKTEKPPVNKVPTVKDTYGHSLVSLDKTKFVCGIEYEIECVDVNVHSVIENIAGMDVTEDGSLKFKGFEFLSGPAAIDLQLARFHLLHSRLKFDTSTGVTPFNERTSTHVHVNVQLLTLEELRVLLYLYILAEGAIFEQYPKPYRQYNIHCVPLQYTNIYSVVSEANSITQLVQHWHKYSALNVIPIKKLGTVEFRHMHGIQDINELDEWLRLLESLYMAATSGITTRDIVQRLYEKWSYRDLVAEYIRPYGRLLRATDTSFETSGILLKQIVMGKI